MLTGDPHLAAADDVAGVAPIALVEDPRPLWEAAGDGDLGDPLQLLLGEPGEEGNTGQQLDRIGGFLPHTGIIAEAQRWQPSHQ